MKICLFINPKSSFTHIHNPNNEYKKIKKKSEIKVMHITIETKELQRVVETVSRVSTKHATLPVLQCVLLEVKEKTLTVKATNLEIGIEGTISVEVKEEGVIAIPAQIFLQTINLISQPTITLISEGDTLQVETKTSKTEIKSIGIEDFPKIPQVTSNPTTISSELFTLGIKSTAFTASQSSIKPELGSIYIHQKREHSLTFVATDSFRLMEKTVPQKSISLEDSILIPYKNALELARVAEGKTGEINLFINENQCALKVDNIYITSRLVSGTFPDYTQIIPKEYKSTLTLLTNDFAQALKKTNIFLNKFQQLTISISEKMCTLSSQSGESGATTETINATVDGENLTLNFNQRYISEVISHVIDDSIRIKCAGVGRPIVIENVHDSSMRYLVMPMNK